MELQVKLLDMNEEISYKNVEKVLYGSGIDLGITECYEDEGMLIRLVLSDGTATFYANEVEYIH